MKDTMMNPWLEDEVKEFRYTHSEFELSNEFAELSDKTNHLDWEDYLTWRTLIDAINYNPFLKLHRTCMDVSKQVKEWLYWNNVDRVLDLVQMSDEELRVISGENKTFYKQVTRFLKKNNIKLRHCPHRTYKISSCCSLLSEQPEKLEKCMINPPGTVHVFNASRPTVSPEWFDEFYRRYEHIQDEEKYCKLTPMTVGITSYISEMEEFSKTMTELWDAYRIFCGKHDITPRMAEFSVPMTYKEYSVFPLYRFIELKKDVLRALIDALEQAGIMCHSPLLEYFEANDEGKLVFSEKEKDESLQLLLVQHVAMRIDYDNIIWFLKNYFRIKDKPCTEWPANPWLYDTVMDFRSNKSDEKLLELYKTECNLRPKKRWIDFILEKAIAQAIDKNSILIAPIEEKDFDNDVKKKLQLAEIKTLGDLVQLTDHDFDILFDGNRFKKEQIVRYLKKQGLRLYHSDLLTYKVPVTRLTTK